jgi:hypothetical protein
MTYLPKVTVRDLDSVDSLASYLRLLDLKRFKADHSRLASLNSLSTAIDLKKSRTIH